MASRGCQESRGSVVVSQANWTEKPAARRMERAAWGRGQEDRRMLSHLDVLHGLDLPVIDQHQGVARL